MIKISYNFDDVDYERKKEIIERSKIVKDRVDKYISFKHPKNLFGVDFILNRSTLTYKNIYHEYLSDIEKTILYLYIIFPSDHEFMLNIYKHKNDYNKIGLLYGVPEKFVKLRYLCLIKMEKEKKELKSNIKK